MPIVPHNTISEPTKVRSPDLFVARPRMAEAMGAVSAAIGDRANAIGRNASILGQIADETGRQGEIRERTAYARLRGQQAMYQTIGNLGGQMMQAGVDLDRIEDHRAEEEANQALTQFTNTIDQRANGYVDPETQEAVPGTFAAPYTHARRDQPASGPSVATAKAVREWYEDPQGPYSQLSPRARAKFDQKAGGVFQSLMAKASQLEYEQIQAFRQQNQKDAIESKRNFLMNTWGGDTQNNTAFWTDAVANANELAAYGMEGMARNPDGTFADAQAQEHYRNGIQDYLKMFATDRINTLMAKAQVEPDDARRAAYLQSAIDTSTYKTGDQPFFNEQERAELNKSVIGIQKAVDTQKAEQQKSANDLAQQITIANALRPGTIPDQEEQAAYAAADPVTRVQIDQTRSKIVTTEESARFDDLRNAYLASGSQADVAVAARYAAGMKSDSARLSALAVLKQDADSGVKASIQAMTDQQKQVRDITNDQLSMVIESGRLLNPDGTVKKLTDRQRYSLLLGALEDRQITWDDYLEKKKEISKGLPKDTLILDIALDEVRRAFGSDDVVNEAFTNADGIIQIAYRNTGTTQHPNYKPVYSDDKTIGKIQAQQGQKIKTVKLSAACVRDVLRTAMRWRQAQVADGKDPDPRTEAEFVRSLLDFTGKNALPSAVALNEHIVQERIRAENETLSQLEDEMARREQMFHQ